MYIENLFKREFFINRNALNLAVNLLGHLLIHQTKQGTLIGKIVETEAYLSDDPASHSVIGKTKRNAPMFERGGIAYIYFTYGMHYCFNIVSGNKNMGEAVLIRAIEPIKGIEIMRKNRRKQDIKILTNGPAKLTQAFGINKKYNYHKLNKRPLFIAKNHYKIPKKQIIQTTRIGIKKGTQLPYRFYIKGNSFVSKK